MWSNDWVCVTVEVRPQSHQTNWILIYNAERTWTELRYRSSRKLCCYLSNSTPVFMHGTYYVYDLNWRSCFPLDLKLSARPWSTGEISTHCLGVRPQYWIWSGVINHEASRLSWFFTKSVDDADIDKDLLVVAVTRRVQKRLLELVDITAERFKFWKTRNNFQLSTSWTGKDEYCEKVRPYLGIRSNPLPSTWNLS